MFLDHGEKKTTIFSLDLRGDRFLIFHSVGSQMAQRGSKSERHHKIGQKNIKITNHNALSPTGKSN